MPNHRAYELVSPPDKSGGTLAASTSRTRAAADGDAVGFESLEGFGDVRGTGIGSDYVSVRSRSANPGDSGWSAHGITPAQQPLTLLDAAQGQDPLYTWEFSADLSTGIFRALSPLTDAPMVANIRNLYVRRDLLTPGAGTYQLLTDCAICGSPFPAPFPFAAAAQRPFVAGASADFSHIIFESSRALATGGVAGEPNLYEWVDGSLRLAGVLPDSACGSPPCFPPRSKAGQGAGAATNSLLYTFHTISADGSKVFFTVGADKFARRGDLYVRDDHGTPDTADDSTVQINQSERTDCADPGPCTGAPEPDPNGHQPASYWNASTDGTRVFFTTSEKLTDDADGSVSLYMWESTASPGHRLTLLSKDDEPADGTNEVDGVVGTSDDGHYVYFMAGGQLIAGGPRGSSGLYVWHNGSRRFIGGVPGGNDVFDVPTSWTTNPVRARVTPDGKHMLFLSTSGDNLLSLRGGTDYDQQGHQELYLYDAVTDTLACASCRPDGVPATTDADDTGSRVGMSTSDISSHMNHALSDDGRFVFFSTAEPLVSDDVNGKSDAYEYDAQTGTVHLISSGRDPGDSFFLDAGANGRDVFFLTRQQLVGWDVDQSEDLYDARIDGGFPEPPRSPASCTAEACRAAPSAAPPAAPPGSSFFQGAGDARTVSKPKPKAIHCRRGFVRKRVHGKVRCVKKTKRKPKANRRVARAERSAK